MNHSRLKDTAITAAKEAGKILMCHYGNVAAEYKTEGFDITSLVTNADLDSENKIVSIIKRNFPDHGFYGEEQHDEHTDADYVWYIDPLDGTSNFTRNIPLFGISIGVVHQGQPICGVLYFPALDLLVEAEKGKGAFANGKQVGVSDRPLNKALYYSGGKYKGDLHQLHRGIAGACSMVKIIDASSYEFAQIAMGNAEVYFLANVLHDVAAGVCIVREAGGLVSDREGNDWQLSSKEILATTPTLFKELVEILRQK